MVIRLIVLSLSLFMVSWKLPGKYASFESPATSEGLLSYVVVELNGKKHLIKNTEELTLIRGDQFKILSAHLNDRNLKPKTVDLIGYPSGKRESKDLNVSIDSVKGLLPHWALDKKKTVYAAVVYSGNVLHGVIYIRTAMPKLQYADIVVNKKLRVMRDDETLILDANDKIKVKKVVTNLESDEDVRFEVVPSDNPALVEKHIRPAKSYELRFNRKGLVFAKIPMLVENL